MTNPKDEAATMPEEIWYSQKTVENNGKKYILHFVSPTETEENKTRYHIADGFEKYIADRVDERLKEISHRAVSGGEALEALDRLNEYAFGDEDDRKDYETVKQALTRQPVETKPVEQEEFIEKTGYVDIYDKIIASGFIITRKD